METSNIKSYAPKARLEFMDAVAKRLSTFGISVNKKGELQVTEAIIQGSVLQIGDNNFDSSLAQRRQRLVERSQQLGYEQLVEQVAYTWFNRLSAIRYMEIHGYLGHGFRVLSHPSAEKQFEIIDHAQDAAEELGLDRNHIIDLKLAGNKNEALYRELLLGQCHKLHEAMPFLFEALNDETELLLPDNLTRTDSILRGLVDSIPEEDWQQVEVIGWLYQFYISDKKDEVIGKVVKSEDIPAATQLFTPNWIVKYLVQNSVGRHWLQTYPDSPIKAEMEYYIEPAEQTEEVNEQLKAITPESIDPETIKVLDPASGSGHILIEAYNILKAIYEERGYRSRDIPKLILEKNIYGLDIDDRAAQLSGFSLMMMARQDDRRIFSRDVRLNVLSLQETEHLDLPKLWQDLNLSGDWTSGATQDMFGGDLDLSSFEADNRYQLLQRNIERFKQAKTFGSLIEVPAAEYEALKELHDTVLELSESGDSIQRAAASQIIDVVHQALLLSIRYDAVVANPPYMGSRGMNRDLKDFVNLRFPLSKHDLYSVMMERSFNITVDSGYSAMIVMESWMFLSSYLKFREWVLSTSSILSMVHMPYVGKGRTPLGINFGTSAYIMSKQLYSYFIANFSCIRYFEADSFGVPFEFPCNNERNKLTTSNSFLKIPSKTIAYWVSETSKSIFEEAVLFENIAKPRQGMATSDVNRFIRYWYEVSYQNCSFRSKNNDEAVLSGKKWFPHSKGGEFRRWYGNNVNVVNWENGGEELLSFAKKLYGSPTRTIKNIEHYFKPSVTWSLIGSSDFSARVTEVGSTFDVAGPSAFPDTADQPVVAAYLNSNTASYFIKVMNPTMNFNSGDIARLPWFEIKTNEKLELTKTILKLINIHRNDWNSSELSFNFERHSLFSYEGSKLNNLYEQHLSKSKDTINEVINLEETNNQFFINKFGLSSELASQVSLDRVSLFCNPKYRYSGSSNFNNRYQSDFFSTLISYLVGLLIGRYSLDQDGLVYAHVGNEGFDASLYQTFAADSDGIIPITDEEWFKDDVSNRVVEFVKTVWGEENLTENLQFIADSLCLDAIKPKNSESAAATIRRYLSTQFYKDHMQTYKNRPIYWLFSSGKEKAFECLVYLHRYNESTLSRMRTEYVTPLLGKYQAYAEQLDKQIEMAESTQDKKRLERELKSMDKKQSELREFDDKLKHYADMRISIDLDDGVKENYGKFGDLLAEVKKITGEKPEIINAD